MPDEGQPPLDLDLFRKVHETSVSDDDEGHRAGARIRANTMAARAGLKLSEAIALLDDPQPTTAVVRPENPTTGAANFFAGFDEWMERKEPGYLAEKRSRQAERDARDDRRRTELLDIHGNADAILDRTPAEKALLEAIRPLVSRWSTWTVDGEERLKAETIDGKEAIVFWSFGNMTPATVEAVRHAIGWPATLRGVLDEILAWDRLRLDRGLFCGGHEWQHHPEVECRVAVLENAIEGGQEAETWDDVLTRFEWKRYEFARGYLDPTKREDPFLDRMEADVRRLSGSSSIIR